MRAVLTPILEKNIPKTKTENDMSRRNKTSDCYQQFLTGSNQAIATTDVKVMQDGIIISAKRTTTTKLLPYQILFYFRQPRNNYEIEGQK